MDRSEELRWWDAVQQQDDKHSFARLYLKYWERLYAIAWARTRDGAVSEDMVQDVFVTLWERRKTIVLRNGFSPYVTGILKFRLIDYFQSEQVKQRILGHILDRMEAVMPDSDNQLSHQAVEDIFEEELGKMPENMRRSLLLRLEKQSTPQIAARLDLAEQTVSNLLTEAFKRLRKTLSHRFSEHSTPAVIALCHLLHDLLINT